jgi:hypothetical protein
MFDGLTVEPLPILAELRGWLPEDLRRSRVPLDGLDKVVVTAQLSLAMIDWDARSNRSQYFGGEGEIQGARMHRCAVHCGSVVRSGDAEYHGEFRDSEDWPVGWPPR